MKTIIYISGPMRGQPDLNRALFAEVAEAILDSYPEAEVINPAANFDGNMTAHAPSIYMATDLAQVLTATHLCLLPGWHLSEGAGHEVDVARWTGKGFIVATLLSNGYWEFGQVPDAPSRDASPRASVLDEARQLITGDRNNTYGPPTQDFARTAGALNAYGYRAENGRELQAHDIAIMMIALKMSRLVWTPERRDSWVDAAGYAACGYECAIGERTMEHA